MKNINRKPIKSVFAILLLLSFPMGLLACDACKKQQPNFLQGITHGGGPDSSWDYVIVAGMVFITCYVLIATIRCIFKPAENSKQHIKRMILND